MNHQPKDPQDSAALVLLMLIAFLIASYAIARAWTWLGLPTD